MILNRINTYDNGLTRAQIINDFSSQMTHPLYVIDMPVVGVDGKDNDQRIQNLAEIKQFLRDTFASLNDENFNRFYCRVRDNYYSAIATHTSYHSHAFIEDMITGEWEDCSLVIMTTDPQATFNVFYTYGPLQNIMRGLERHDFIDEEDEDYSLDFVNPMSVEQTDLFSLVHELSHAVDPRFQQMHYEVASKGNASQERLMQMMNKSEFFADMLAVLYMKKQGIDVALEVSQMRAMQIPVYRYASHYDASPFSYINHTIHAVIRKENPDVENMDMAQLIGCAVKFTKKYGHRLDRFKAINQQFMSRYDNDFNKAGGIHDVYDVQRALRPFVKNMPKAMPRP